MMLAPLLLSIAAGAATVKAPDGVAIAYESHGSGETAIVLIHGWCCNRTYWNDTIGALSRDGRRIVAINLPGHGESGANREKWTIEAFARDVKAVCDALELKRIVLVGHSMGGPVSLLATPLMRGRVFAVVGVDTLHDAELEMPKEMMAAIMASFERDFEAAIKGTVALMPAATPESVRTRIVESAVRSDRKAAIALFKDFPNLDAKALLQGAQVPVRCVNAAPLPPMVPTTTIEKNRKYCDFDAVIIEGVGHFPMLEKPAEFNEKLEATIAHVERAAKKGSE